LSAPYIVSPLTHIYNVALNSGIFADRLKYATAKPIHNKGTLQDLTNYRPISHLTAFSKTFEKLIYARLHTNLVDNNILTPQQFGFRAHCSTDQATFSLVNSILKAMNQNLMIGRIFRELHMAFDSVNNEIIFEKVKFCGIVGKLHVLLRSHLSNRYQ
jgi:hypothetical protein